MTMMCEQQHLLHRQQGVCRVARSQLPGPSDNICVVAAATRSLALFLVSRSHTGNSRSVVQGVQIVEWEHICASFCPGNYTRAERSNAAVCREEERAGGWTILAVAEKERNIMATKYGTRRPTFSYSRRCNQYAECAIISSPLFDNETHTRLLCGGREIESERWKGQLGANSGRGTSLKFPCAPAYFACKSWKLESLYTRFGVEATFPIRLCSQSPGWICMCIHTDTERARGNFCVPSHFLASCILMSALFPSSGGPRARGADLQHRE
jgi:hypothetical protein